MVLTCAAAFTGCVSKNQNGNHPYPTWLESLTLEAGNPVYESVDYAPPKEKPKARNKKPQETLIKHLKVLFDYDQTIIREDYYNLLKEVADVLTADLSLKITIQGHTCSIGDESFNLKLSMDRAVSVKEHLVSRYGIAADRFTLEGLGESLPDSDNTSEEGRRQNRRVVAEVKVTEAVKDQEVSRFRFDYLNKPLSNLTDFSEPQKDADGPSKKQEQKKKPVISTQPYVNGNADGPDGNPGWGGNKNINILVNQSGTDEKQAPAEPEEPLSRIEKRYNLYGELTKGKKVRQYGYNLVRWIMMSPNEGADAGEQLIREKRGAMVFSQTDNTRLFSQSKGEDGRFYSNQYSAMRPVSSDYVISSGDEVFVKLTGPVEIAEVYAVDRDGRLFIPQIGSIQVGGRKASELESLVMDKAKEIFVNVRVEATLGRLRSIQVTVSGNVFNPGLIEVPANSSLLNALAASGGPTKDGTLRRVILHRRDAPSRDIDLYSVLLSGDFSQDPVMLPGDVIYVGPIGPTVAMLSPGDDGAIYELTDGATLSAMAAFLGITGTFTDIETVLIERNDPESGRRIESLDAQKHASTFVIADGDIFQFFPTHPYSYNSVAISGPVLRPGTYPFNDTMKVSDLLNLGNGFLINTSLNKALLIRELGESTSYSILPGDKRGHQRKQLIWLDLAKILSGDPSQDIPLERLDRLKLFTTEEDQPQPMVSIIGGIRKPGEYVMTSSMTLGDLIGIAAGPTDKAYDGESTIVRRRHSQDGKRHFDVGIITFNLSEVINGGPSAKILLENQDKIVIRQVNTMEVSAKIEGWVQFPGMYILPSGSKIQDLIKIAGGIHEGADLRAAVFKRKRVADLQNRRLKSFYAQSTEQFARNRDKVTLSGSPSESFATQLSLMGQDRLYMNMMQFQTTGRVVIDLTSETFPASDDNLVIEDGDVLSIPQKMTTVMVMGRIFNPSGYLWKPGQSVEDYLENSGGLLEDADKNHIYVVMANGEVKSAAQKGGRSRLMSFKPGPGDIVFVPQKTLDRTTMSQVMDVLQMLRLAVETGAVGAAIPNMSYAIPTVDLGYDGYQKKTVVDQVNPDFYTTEPRVIDPGNE